MALAARLSLRMQKELKLLLNDPPPGVSVLSPSDSEGQSCSSLSVINASVEGPDGTAYANGVFLIRIHIPERYPFLPPNVTFVTPIYHPNIDNGGRICLDILNMPPKGAWMPSLNISTVLTSIALLLSDPNPDDGLMCEISKEYKYNRQVFEQKARSWTERFAQRDICLSSYDACNLASSSEGIAAEQEDKSPKYPDFNSPINGGKVHNITGRLSPGRATEKGRSNCEENASYDKLLLASPNSETSPRELVSYNEKGNDAFNSKISLSLSRNFTVSKAASPEGRSGGYKENVKSVQHPPSCHLQNSNPSASTMSIPGGKENNRHSMSLSGKIVKTKKVLADSNINLGNAGSPSKTSLPHIGNVVTRVQSDCRVPGSSLYHPVAQKASFWHLKNSGGSSKDLILKRAANSSQHLPGQNRIAETCIHKESDAVLNSLPNKNTQTTEVVIVSDSEESDDEGSRHLGNKMYSSRMRMAGFSKYKRLHISHQ